MHKATLCLDNTAVMSTLKMPEGLPGEYEHYIMKT